MALPTQPYKGARDFYPEDMRLQKYLFATLREVVERYGYEEYDAPILESLELYKAKSGEEIVNEQTYTFEDRGGRQVVIRPEMTPTVSRMVAARRQELGYPLRWYSIPNLWRYERPQKGRLREHWQLNVDLFGIDGTAAENELIHVTDSIMRRLGADHSMYKIRLNDRRFIDHLLHSYAGFDEVQSQSIGKLIDRMHKMEPADFQTQLDALCTPSQREDGTTERLLAVLSVGQLENLPPELVEHESLKDLKELLTNLLDDNIANVVFDPTLMRGFDYYSGIVFEVFDVSPDNNRSLFGGGRYDGLVGLFGVDPVSTVGFGMGDVVLADFLETHGLLPKLLPETHLYAVVVDEPLIPRAEKVVTQLRKEGVNVALDISGKSLDKQFKTANKKGVPYVVVIGKKELDDDRYILKDMQSGIEETHGVERIASIVEDARRPNLEVE
jgi:histidyl-tRNA synthetase